jgi:hypothetical protein
LLLPLLSACMLLLLLLLILAVPGHCYRLRCHPPDLFTDKCTVQHCWCRGWRHGWADCRCHPPAVARPGEQRWGEDVCAPALQHPVKSC